MHKAIICLRILLAINSILGTSLVLFPFFAPKELPNSEFMWLMGGIMYAFSFFYWRIIHGLKQKSYWAWVSAIVIFSLNVFSILFPVAIVGLVSITRKDVSRSFFNREESYDENEEDSFKTIEIDRSREYQELERNYLREQNRHSFFIILGISSILMAAVVGWLYFSNENYKISNNSMDSIADNHTPSKRSIDKEYVNNLPLSAKAKNALAQRKDRPCAADLNYAIGEILTNEGNYDYLESFYKTFRKECGEFLELRWMVFSGAKKQGDFKQAERLVSSLINDYPDDKDYYGWRGMLYQRYNLHSKAILDFKKAIEIVPELKSIPLNLVESYIKTKSYCKGLSAITKYMDVYPHLKKKKEFISKQVNLSSRCQNKALNGNKKGTNKPRSI